MARSGEVSVRAAIGEAMNRNSWFKRQARGAELGRKLLALGVPAEINDVIGRFWYRLIAVLR